MCVSYVPFFIFFYLLSLQHYCSLRRQLSNLMATFTNFLIGHFFNYFLSDQLVEQVVMFSISEYIYFFFYIGKTCGFAARIYFTLSIYISRGF